MPVPTASETTIAKARSSELKLARLRELRSEPPSSQRLQELRGAINDTSNLVVAEAAEIAGGEGLADLTANLVEAFVRLLEDPIKTDKTCRAKIAIVEALNKLEFADEDFYLRGSRYIQFEPAWGGATDSAVPLRVASVFGLVRLRYRGVLPLLVDMLAASDRPSVWGAPRR